MGYKLFHVKHYKVKALSVGGKGKKIFKSGDIVHEGHFPEGNAEELVKQGFLEEHEVEEEEKKSVQPEADEPVVTRDGKRAIPSIDEISTSEIVDELVQRQIGFSSDMEKEQLYDLLIGGEKKEVASTEETKPLMEDITKKQIIEKLTQKQIVHDADSSKTVLYNLLFPAE